MKKILSIFGLVMLTMAMVTAPVLASGAGNNANNMVYVGPNEVVDGNLFKAGNVVEIAGTVKGDLFVAGNMVNVTGNIEGDVFAVGSMVKIDANVGGNVRVAGSNVEISGRIERNVLAAGGNLIVAQNANIGWGATMAGGNVEMRGRMNRTMEAGAGNLIIAGEVVGDLKARVDSQENNGGLTLYPTAIVRGNMDYSARNEANIQEGARITGKINHNKIEEQRRDFNKTRVGILGLLGFGWLLAKLIGLFGMWVVGLILVGLTPKVVERINETMTKKFWASTGWGLVWLVLTPVVCFVLMLTLIGMPIALMGMAIYLVALCLAKVFAGIVIGKYIFKVFGAKKVNMFWEMILGVFVFMVVCSVPLIGWLAGLVGTLWALGALVAFKKEEIGKWK